MAIVSVEEQLNQRGGSAESQDAQHPNVRTYIRTFRVYCDDMNDGPAIALSAPQLPYIFSPYIFGNEIDIFTLLKSKTIAAVDYTVIGGPCFDVLCTYSTLTQQPQNPDQDQSNPLNRPPILGLRFEKESVPVEKDINGDKIVNAAGDPFIPPPVVTRSRPILTIQRNESSISINNAQAFVDHTNSDSFLGAKAGTALIRDIRCDQEFEGEYVYWKCVYEIAFASSGFDLNLANRGFNCLTVGGNLNTKVLCKDALMQPVQDPQYLNKDGTVVATQAQLDASTSINYTVYKRCAFSTLNFGGIAP